MSPEEAGAAAPIRREPGWRDLLAGANLVRSLALAGGAGLHATNLYVSTTILPSVVRDIGGLAYYAWNTTVFVVASILGSAVASRLLARLGARAAYAIAAAIFAAGSLLCAAAPAMATMLVGRFVQGLGGGLLLALPYALIRTTFAEPLWPRAMALFSGVWGIATLLGPTIGGIFAELGNWRAAFWSLAPATAALTLAAVFVLPRRKGGAPAPPLPGRQLALLTAAVLAASASSVAGRSAWSAGGLLLAVTLVAAVITAESRARHRLLPRGAFRITKPLGALYLMSALLAMTVTCTEIFVPLFLQELRGLSPLEAGYLAALMSVGWTVGAIVTSSLHEGRLILVLRGAALLSVVSMAALAVLLPGQGGGGWVALTPLCIALVAGGAGVGIAYPHLSASILRVAPADEAEIAGSSIMTVQLCATAFGASLAGVTVNLAGLGDGPEGVAGAARWLFVVFALGPALCLMIAWGWRQPAER